MSCWFVSSFDLRWKNRRSASARVFSSTKSNELADQQTCFALIAHLLSIRTTTSWQVLRNNTLKAQILTKNPTGNVRCHVLASRAINMSCSFDQSVRSIESGFVVIDLVHPDYHVSRTKRDNPGASCACAGNAGNVFTATDFKGNC